MQCGICRTVTRISQVLSPQQLSSKSGSNQKTFTFSTSSDDHEDDMDIKNQKQPSICSPNSKLPHFATLPTQLQSSTHKNPSQNSITTDGQNEHERYQFDSFHKLVTSPLKQYKHHRSHRPASSAPVKHSSANGKDNAVRQFQYHKIVDLQKEIESLKCELQQNKDIPDGQSEENEDSSMKHEMSFLKQQVVELMMEKQKLLKKCNDLVRLHRNNSETELSSEHLSMSSANSK